MAVKLDERSRARVPKASAPGAAKPRSERAGDTLPPTPLSALAAEGGADLIVLSTDAQLIDTATRASRDHLHVWPVASWSELETALAVTRRAVVLVDAELLGKTARARVVALDAYSHKVVTLVAADRSVAQGLMGLLSERKVHRLLIKPPALGITRLLIDSAVGRCLKLADANEPSTPVTPEQPPPRVQRREPAALPLWVFATAGVALLAGVAAIASVSTWWPWSEEKPLAQSPAPAVLATGGSDSRETLAAEQLSAHDVDGYLAARYAAAESALLANDYAAAGTALADVRRVDPASTRLTFLEAQVRRAQQAALTPRVADERRPASIGSTELESLITLARASIQRGDLLDPNGESAREYVARAERVAPRDRDVAALRRELAAALLAAAQRAMATTELARAAAFSSEARRLGAEASELARLDSELARLRSARAAQQHSEWLALADARVRQGALLEPATDNARHYLSMLQEEAPEHAGLAAAWTAFSAALEHRISRALVAHDWAEAEQGVAALAEAPNGANASESLRTQLATAKLEERYLTVAAPASELELLERAPPVYPRDAARDGLEGWVDVEFVVDQTGRARDFEVVAAEPKGQFEEAALAALAKYRYRPFSRDGRLFSRRVGLRIRFNLE